MLKRLAKVSLAALLFSAAALLVALHTHPGLGRWHAYLADSSDTMARDNALRINWLGTATVHISDGKTDLLTDPVLKCTLPPGLHKKTPLVPEHLRGEQKHAGQSQFPVFHHKPLFELRFTPPRTRD